MKRHHLPIWYGISIGVYAIVYFLLLSLFGLHENPFYSSANIAFFGVGQFLLIVKFKQVTEGLFKYQDGFWAMFKAGIIATFIIAAFFLSCILQNSIPIFYRKCSPCGKKIMT